MESLPLKDIWILGDRLLHIFLDLDFDVLLDIDVEVDLDGLVRRLQLNSRRTGGHARQQEREGYYQTTCFHFGLAQEVFGDLIAR